MYTNNFNQLYSFIIFIIVGSLISIIYDLFRVSRKVFNTSDFFTYIEDIIFWIITGIIILLSIFLYNNGELRLYIFIGLILGIIIYILFISKYLIKINMILFLEIKKICINFIKVIKMPFHFLQIILKKVFIRPIRFIIINFRKNFSNIFIIFKKIKIFDKKLDKNKGI